MIKQKTKTTTTTSTNLLQLQNYSHNKKNTFNFLSPPVLEAKWNTKTSMKEKMMKALLGLFCFVFNWSYLFLSELAIQTSSLISPCALCTFFPPKLHNDFA